MCEEPGCYVRPSFKFPIPGATKQRCARHKLAGMVGNHSKILPEIADVDVAALELTSATTKRARGEVLKDQRQQLMIMVIENVLAETGGMTARESARFNPPGDVEPDCHDDASAHEQGEKQAGQRQSNKPIIIRGDSHGLQKVLDEYDIHFFECLAYLISEKRITLKIIKPKEGNGIAHYKSGVFHDGVDFVGYKASCNFTLYGLSENLEEKEVTKRKNLHLKAVKAKSSNNASTPLIKEMGNSKDKKRTSALKGSLLETAEDNWVVIHFRIRYKK
jgi:hypothetical protein